MKALLVLVLVLMAAATAFAYGADVAAGMSVVASATPRMVITEPMVMESQLLRVCFVNFRTRPEHVGFVLDTVRELGRRMAAP